MCLKLLLRDDFGNLKCCLDPWFSCMLDCIHICVFPFLKNDFLSNLDTSSIPPRYLAICRALKVFSYRNLDRSSIASGSNKKVLGSSIVSRQLVDRSSLFSCVFALFLDTCIYQRCFSRHLPRQMDRHISTPLFVENY